MGTFDSLQFDTELALPPVPPRESYLRSLAALVPVAQLFAADWNLDVVQNTEDVEKLRVGYYPNKSAFEPFVTQGLFSRLPDARGLVFPYERDGAVTMLVISEMASDSALSRATRAHVFEQGRYFFGKQGFFGSHRLRGKGKREIVLTDDELLVCRTPNAVAVQELCDYSLDLLDRRAKHIVLLSGNPKWLVRMMKLSKLGFDVSVDSMHIIEYVVKQVSDLARADLSAAKFKRKAGKYLRCLPELQQNAVMAAVEKLTGCRSFRDTVRASKVAYAPEHAYYDRVKTLLFSKITSVALTENGLVLRLAMGETRRLPVQPSAVAAVICPLFGDEADLVQWSYNYFNGVPESVAASGPSRWAHNLAVAEIILSVLTRHVDLGE